MRGPALVYCQYIQSACIHAHTEHYWPASDGFRRKDTPTTVRHLPQEEEPLGPPPADHTHHRVLVGCRHGRGVGKETTAGGGELTVSDGMKRVKLIFLEGTKRVKLTFLQGTKRVKLLFICVLISTLVHLLHVVMYIHMILSIVIVTYTCTCTCTHTHSHAISLLRTDWIDQHPPLCPQLVAV